MIHVKRRLGLAVPVFPAAQMGTTPATRIQIYGPYHGPDSPPETTPTRHHRSSPRRIQFPATQVLIGHANRVQPYPQTATGYPKTSMVPPLFLSVRRGGPSPPRASVIDGQGLATVTTACGALSLFYSLPSLSPGARRRLSVSSPVSLSAPRERTYSALVSCDSFLCSWTCTR